MKKFHNPFTVEKFRDNLASKLKYEELEKSYVKQYPEIKDLNSPSFWDYLNIDSRQTNTKNPMEEDRINSVIDLIKGEDIVVLNVGFGSASLERKYFKTQDPVKFQWEGIEISPKSIRQANEDLPMGRFRMGNISKMNFPNSHFDYVIALEVLEHIVPSKILDSLRELFRLVKPGKFLIVSVPLNEGLEKMVALGQNPNAHVRVYTSNLIKAELIIVGFKVLKEKKLFAFNNLYKLKTYAARYVFRESFKHNNIILYAQKPLGD